MSDKQDWATAPKDAQFYSCSAFRKHENGEEFYYADGCWNTEAFDSINFYQGFPDFEMRPESSAPAWDGQGLPPVGTVCEMQYNESQWGEVTITAYGKQYFLFEDDKGQELVEHIDRINLRPIKSDREKWIDAADRLMESVSEEHKRMSCLYDALKSGKLPTP